MGCFLHQPFGVEVGFGIVGKDSGGEECHLVLHKTEVDFVEGLSADFLETDLGCHIEGNVYGASVKGDFCHIIIVLFVIIDCRCLSLDCKLASAFQLNSGSDGFLVVCLEADRSWDESATGYSSFLRCLIIR